MTNVGVQVTTSLCKSCRQLKPRAEMKWLTEHGIYCSQGCAAKAQWLFGTIPTPRKP